MISTKARCSTTTWPPHLPLEAHVLGDGVHDLAVFGRRHAQVLGVERLGHLLEAVDRWGQPGAVLIGGVDQRDHLAGDCKKRKN